MNIPTRSMIGCAVLILTGCGAQAQDQSGVGQTAPAVTMSSTHPDDASRPMRVPDGRYGRVAGAPDATAAGLTGEMVRHLLGEDGRLPMTLEFDRDRFTVTVLNDIELTETGTVTYDPAGRIVLTSRESGVVQVLDWRMDGAHLILALVGATPQERFMVDGRYTREAT